MPPEARKATEVKAGHPANMGCLPCIQVLSLLWGREKREKKPISIKGMDNRLITLQRPDTRLSTSGSSPR